MFRGLLSVSGILIISVSASAQYMMEAKQPDFYSFSKPSEQKLTSEAKDLIPVSYRNHPEYAKNPYNTPCENCTELIDRRKIDERYFVENGTNGQTFYTQTSYGPMHMPDEFGNLITIDPHISEKGSGVFEAEHQLFPVKIDVINHFASLKASEQELKFNTALELLHKNISGELTSLGEANWTNYTAGDEGIKVFDVWQGVDMEIRTMKGKVKTNFIIKEKFLFEIGWLIIKDKLEYGDNLKPNISFTKQSENNFFDKEISLSDKEGNEHYSISRAFAFDANNQGDKQNYYLNYELKEDHDLLIYIPLQWLNSDERVYPVTIDPLVSGTNNVAMATILAPRWGGSACPAMGIGCPYPLVAPVPANCTITNILFSFSYNALGTCWVNQAAFYIDIGACRSPAPGGIWTCANPGNNPGACTGNNYQILPQVNACIPPPQCAPYTLTFTMTFFSCNPLNGATCSNNGNNCIVASDNWTMTIQGKTVEIPTITPSQAICVGSNASITATGSFGVGPYTYLWSPGGMTGTTISVSPPTTQAYSVIVTDACAQTATATSTVTVIQDNNPGFTITPNPVCVGQPTTVNGLGGNAVNYYDWSFPNSTTPNPVNNIISPSVTYNSAGTYNMTLNYHPVQNGVTCTFPLTQPVTVTASVGPPTVSISASPSGPICAGTSVTFTPIATVGGTTPTYQWQVNGVNAGTGATFTSTTLNNNDAVTVIMTSNAACVSPATATSNTVTITVTTNLTPSVSIAANPSGPICAGTSVTFTATPTNGGTTPTYQWKINGVNAGTGVTFTSSSLTNNDVVSVVMTSNSSCVSTPTATSNTITMQVLPVLTPSVTIAANPAGPVCSGVNVTFTATPTNGGVAPTYQWQVNGTNAGTGATYSSSSLSNGDVVHVILTSNANCVNPATATSNDIIMSVTPSPVPSVTIADNPTGPVCAGTSITFTPTPTNGGVAPTYQWQVNGVNAATGATFTSTSLNDNDVVTAVMTSNAVCASPLTATSNPITIDVSTNLSPAVTIAANPSGIICAGTSVTFTPAPTNGGSAPTYQWKVNGTNAGTGLTFTSTTLNQADVVSVVMTSNATCVSTTTANSNNISMLVLPVVAPSVTIAVSPAGAVCAGSTVTFTPTATNGGVGPTYQWEVNGTNAGTGATFISTTLNDGDNVSVILTSNAACVSPTTATSNVVTMVVTPTVMPSVTITAVPSGQICSGTSVTFTPTPTNGGANPTYQWQVNGINSGAGATFTSAALINGDVVTVVLTSDAVCASPVSVTSAPITMDVSTTIIPSVTVAVAPSTTICSGEIVVFTATTSGGGNTPTFQWTVNGVNAGTADIFSSNTLTDGDVVAVTLTSSAGCADPSTATSQPVAIDVMTNVSPAVTIVASPPGPICSGATVTFTANGTNGGNTPAYQWMLNGIDVGSGGITFSSNLLAEGDIVSVSLTSSETCVSGNPATSNPIVISLAQPISVAASNDTVVCSSDPIDITAQATGGDGIYSYTWNNGAGNGSSVNVNPAQTTTYLVTVTDQCGTTPASDDVTVTVNQPVASFGFSPVLPDMNNAEVHFENQSQGGVDYFWDFGDGTSSTDMDPIHNFASSGDYEVTLTVTSAGGCVETTTYIITVDDVMAFWVPSAFTPNGDGLNDTFFMNGTMNHAYVMRVYNRLGSEIYFTDNSEPWNGAIFNVGDVVPNGVYVYEIDLEDTDFKGKTLTGRVNVIRDGR